MRLSVHEKIVTVSRIVTYFSNENRPQLLDRIAISVTNRAKVMKVDSVWLHEFVPKCAAKNCLMQSQSIQNE